jgi:phosphoribosylpyrophosphate synthetase
MQVSMFHISDLGWEHLPEICDRWGTQQGDAESLRFSEGNLFVRVLETVRDKECTFQPRPEAQ